MLTSEQIKEHYRRKEVMDTIIRVSTDGNCTRAGAKLIPKAYTDKRTGESKDSLDWYDGEYGKRKHDYKIDMADKNCYNRSIECGRTLYYTLNMFNEEIFKVAYDCLSKEEKTPLSRYYTTGYTFGIDIDVGKEYSIHDDGARKAVEELTQFYSDKLRDCLPNSVYCLYSGGGIYVMVHHKAFDCYVNRFINTDQWDMMIRTLQDAFDALIKAYRDEFFDLHPEYVGKVKPDELNNAQRLFKTIYSVHKSLDYAVVPLDPENIHIDFNRATIPLSKDVLIDGNEWYTDYDDGGYFIEHVLKPYLEEAIKPKNSYVQNVDIPISKVPIRDTKLWAPCMRNLYNLPKCGEGQTRALAVFVSFLGQIGISSDEAYAMFSELADRWGARKENLFNSYFYSMKVPSCARLGSDDNRGFPKGVSIKCLGVCKPDMKCLNVPSPRYYTDKVANNERLLSPAQESTPIKRENTRQVASSPISAKSGNGLSSWKPVIRKPIDGSFSDVVQSVKLIKDDYNNTNLVFEFAETVPLKINLRLDNWKTIGSGKIPKSGSAAHSILLSMNQLNLCLDVDDYFTKIDITPSIIGKVCKFDTESKSLSKEGKTINFQLWKLVEVSEPITA